MDSSLAPTGAEGPASADTGGRARMRVGPRMATLRARVGRLHGSEPYLERRSYENGAPFGAPCFAARMPRTVRCFVASRSYFGSVNSALYPRGVRFGCAQTRVSEPAAVR